MWPDPTNNAHDKQVPGMQERKAKESYAEGPTRQVVPPDVSNAVRRRIMLSSAPIARRRTPMRAAALAVALLFPATTRAGDEITLGTSAPFSGPSRGLGVEFFRGASAYLAEVNAKGGVHRHKLRLIARDDGYDPATAVANTRKLVTDDRVFLLFGQTGTPTTARTLPLLERYKDDHVFLFCPLTGAETVRQGPYAPRVFNLRASYRQETAQLVKRLLAIGLTRIGVFYQIDSYGRSGWDGVRRALAEKKLPIAAEATYRRGTGFDASMTRQVEILRGKKVDAVICVATYAACAAFIRDARDAGWDVPIANLSFVGSENLLALLRRHGEKHERDYAEGLINSQVVPCPSQTDLPAVKLYCELMDRHKPRPPACTEEGYEPLGHTFHGLEGFLAARLVVEVLKKLGPEMKREKLRAAAESLGEIDLGLPKKASLGRDRRQASNDVWFAVVEKGKWAPLGEGEADWKRWRK
jgi:ABC-type branched-subunit amino acid transport system substrate-binding protein